MADDAGQLQFAVLGPVAAYRAGTEVAIGPAKQRAVLAMLLLLADRPVSRDEIIDGVWGERVPRSAANLVATYVAGLRRVVDPGRARRSGGTVLVSTSAGYRLRLSPDQLDLHVFERSIAAAHRDTGRVAATALDDALALWRGQPLGGITGPYADGERQRLVELRLTTVERRIEVGLDIGEPDWVAELRRLVAAHPYRERMRALQMLALYRAGRRADALEVFDDAHRTFAHDLGIEPGPELCRLHHRMLSTDPALDHPPRSAATIRRPVAPPAQLPADPADFSGRSREVAALCDRVGAAADRPPVVAVVTGPAGIGKTALALHVAHRCRSRFPDGQFHVDLRGTGGSALTADDVLARFLADLGVDPAHLPALPDRRAALLRTLLAGRRMLVLLDDALDVAQVDPLLPGTGRCTVLITSRTRLAHPAVGFSLTLGPLAAGDALALLARIAGHERIAAEPVAAAEILSACAGLPLAVRIAGLRLVQRPRWTVRALADRLRAPERCLAELRAGGLAVRPSLLSGYAMLTAGGEAAPARAFRLLGLLDTDGGGAEMTAALVAGVLGCLPHQAERDLERLVDLHLVESRAAGRYRLPPLVRLLARELAGAHEPAASATLDRAVRHYLTAVRRADRKLRPARMIPDDRYGDEPYAARFASIDEALAWLERERTAIIGVGLRAAATPGVDPMLTAALVTDLRAFMHRRGHWDDLRRLASAALAAARRDGHLHAAALALLELGAVAYLRQRLGPAEAHLRRSLALFRQVRDQLGLSRALNNLSLVCAELGRLDEAAALVEEDLAVLRRLGDRFGESVALDNLALVEVRQGRYETAAAHCARSVELYRAAGARPLSCTALNLLGHAQAGLGRPTRAAWCHRRSSQLARRGGNRYWQAQALSDLAMAYRRAGRPRRAMASGRQAVLIYQRLGDRHGTITAMRRVAEAYATLGRRGTA